MKAVFISDSDKCSFNNQIVYNPISPSNTVNPLLILKGYSNKDTVMICLANKIIDTAFGVNPKWGYRWGRTLKSNLDETIFDTEHGQEFLFRKGIGSFSVVDTQTYFYWVEVKLTLDGCERRIYLEGNEPFGHKKPLEEIASNISEVKVYPNPVQNDLNVELIGSMNDDHYTIDIYDVTGNTLQRINMTSNKITIPVQNLPSGYYLVHCRKNGIRFATEKFIKN